MVRETPGMEQGLTEVLAEREGDWSPDWADIIDKFQWVAVDACGAVWAYIDEPHEKQRDSVWGIHLSGDTEMRDQAAYLTTIDMDDRPADWWRTAKWRRPQ